MDPPKKPEQPASSRKGPPAYSAANSDMYNERYMSDFEAAFARLAAENAAASGAVASDNPATAHSSSSSVPRDHLGLLKRKQLAQSGANSSAVSRKNSEGGPAPDAASAPAPSLPPVSSSSSASTPALKSNLSSLPPSLASTPSYKALPPSSRGVGHRRFGDAAAAAVVSVESCCGCCFVSPL